MTTPDARTAPRGRRELQAPEISALCYDRRRVLSGALTAITREGCEFRGFSRASAAPFAPDSRIVLNLFSSSAGRSLSLLAEVASITRDPSGWILQLRLDEDLPSELFQDSTLQRADGD